ncbi:MAG TPA: hypothetical protein VMU81_02180 [Acetobacteraceae bacterium]|nr:hypothetical protein [Acetobacteraceae bacterium]
MKDVAKFVAIAGTVTALLAWAAAQDDEPKLAFEFQWLHGLFGVALALLWLAGEKGCLA